MKGNKIAAMLLAGGLVFAVGGMGISALRSSRALAEENEASVAAIPSPTFNHRGRSCVVSLIWNTNVSSGQQATLELGEDPNPNYNYFKSIEANTYTEIRVPSVNSDYVYEPYYWMRNKVGGSYSDVENLNPGHAYLCYNVVNGRIVDGELTPEGRTIEVQNVSLQEIEISCVYGGQYTDTTIELLKPTGVMVGDVIFTIIVTEHAVTVRTSQTITCSSVCSSEDTYGAFAFSIA